MATYKLTAMPYAQAYVEMDDHGTLVLVSYVTPVAVLTVDGWLKVLGLHSMTTRKHISAFCREYCGAIDYQSARKAYEGNYRINIGTGEIQDL